MANILFRRKQGLTWELKHEDSGVILRFVEGRFNDKQEVELSDDAKANPDVMYVARVMREIGDVAGGDDFAFISMCNEQMRAGIVEAIWTVEWLAEACELLHGLISPDDVEDYGCEDILGLIADKASIMLFDVLDTFDDDELQDLVLMVDAYWTSPYGTPLDWAKDYFEWASDIPFKDEEEYM